MRVGTGFLVAACCAALTFGGTRRTFADDDTDAQIAALKKQIELLTTERAKSDAEKAKLDADKALADAQKSATDADAQKIAALQAQKNLADAQKALSESESTAWLAKNLGTVTAGPYSGAVAVNDKAGVLEALLLASKAVQSCSLDLAKAVKSKIPCSDPCQEHLYIYRSSQMPTFRDVGMFNFRASYVKKVLERAIKENQNTSQTEAAHPENTEAVPVGAAASGILDAVGKLLGFAKSDSTVNGIDAKLDEQVLLHAVAGAFQESKFLVHVPTLYASPSVIDLDAIFKPPFDPTKKRAGVEDLVVKLAQLDALRDRAANVLAKTNDKIVQIDAEAKNAKATKKDQLKPQSDKLRAAAANLTAAIAGFDSFASYLSTPDTHGDVPLSTIAAESSMQQAFAEHAKILVISLETTGGGTLVKKNLLTGLGSMPLFHMGGAAISYVLIDGKDGHVMAGDVIPYFGGYTRTDRLAEIVNPK
jgi:hypothetical protein